MVRWFRISVSVTLLGIVIYLISIDGLLHALARVKLSFVLLAFIIASMGNVFSTLRWRAILTFYGHDISFIRLFRLYYIGKFFNMVLPGTIGGDAVRGYKLVKNRKRISGLLLSIPMERLFGLAGLLLLSIISTLVIYRQIPHESLLLLITLVTLLSIFFTLILNHRFRRILMKANSRVIRAMLDALEILSSTRATTLGLLYSIVIHMSGFVTFWCLARAVGADIGIGYIIAFMPIVIVLTMLPISIGGLGIREGLLIYFLGIVSVQAEISVVIGVTGYVLRLATGLIGSLIYVTDRA